MIQRLRPIVLASWPCLLSIFTCPGAAADTIRLSGRIIDDATGDLLAARLYIEGPDGKLFHARSAAAEGKAAPYEKRNGESVEVHTCLTAHPFVADLPPGEFTLTAERGKEWFASTARIALEPGAQPPPVTIRMRRFADLAARGWYSGDTHVHRSLEDLPAVVLAEDLNVALPLVWWVTKAYAAPASGDKSGSGDGGGKLIAVDATHIIYPRNTEYEIFTVDGKRHELGAVFLLGHRTVLDVGAPPVRGIAERVHAEGGLIELDKHCWPWSMALVPVMKVDLYELSNNHIWRTRFGFKTWGEPAAPYMQIERDASGWTERGWIDYGFKNYFALLNCGFRLRPTAGTASGVHPVPLGFGRVYVRTGSPFSYEAWMQGLDAGRSFVTTGPLLTVETIAASPGAADGCRIGGEVLSAAPLEALEVIVNGDVARKLDPENAETPEKARRTRIDVTLPLEGSSWVAVRAWEPRPGGRVRFACSAPVHFDVAGKPLRPRREEVEYLAARVRGQIERSKEVLPAAVIDEYREALRAYETLLPGAR